MKLIKLTLPLLVALAYVPAQAGSSVTSFSPTLTNLNFNGLTVFADTHIGGGATTASPGSITMVYGSVLSGDVATFGAGSSVTGNFESVGAANISARDVGGVQNTSIGGSVTAGGVTTLADRGIIIGNIYSGGTASTGDTSKVGGNITSADVLSIGANASVGGYISSGGTASVSLTGTVKGTVTAVGVLAIDGKTGIVSKIASSPVIPTALVTSIKADVSNVAAQVLSAQTALTALGTGTGFIPVTNSMSLTPGVYSAASWSPTAQTTYTLDAGNLDNQAFVFNMSTILAFGAGTKIVMINAGKNDTVVWNVSAGYASLGDGAHVIGTILARDYISVGANAIVTGIDGACGGVYSQTSYVSTGDSASIGGSGCTVNTTPPSYTLPTPSTTPQNISAVPEPETYAMMLAGLGLLGFAVSRKKQS